MVASSELFDLIKRMSQSEKRYFTLNARFNEGTKGYLILFKETDKMEDYDEAVLKQRLKQLNFNVDHFSVAKVNLTKVILRALRAFHEKNSPEQGILALLLEGDILTKKGLYGQALRHLEKAKKTAKDFGMQYYISDILNRQIHINLTIARQRTEQKLNGLFEEIEQLKSTIYKETELRVIATKITHILHTKPLNHPATIALIEEMKQHEMLQSISDNDSFFAKLYYFFAHAQLKHARKEYTTANPIYLKILELWDRHPNIRDINQRIYKSHIANYLNSCHTLGQYGAFEAWLEKFNQLKDLNFDEVAGSFKDYYHINLLYLLNTKQFHKALDLVPRIEEGLILYKTKINKPRETAMRFNVFIVFFINEKFSKALDWLGTMELDTNIDSKADARTLARIMRVIVHYELGHTRILEDLRTSVYRKLKKQEQLHEFERAILDHIKQLEQATDRGTKKRQWEILLKKLNSMGEKYGWNKIAGLEEIAAWAESRLLKKPYITVLEQKK